VTTISFPSFCPGDLVVFMKTTFVTWPPDGQGLREFGQVLSGSSGIVVATFGLVEAYGVTLLTERLWYASTALLCRISTPPSLTKKRNRRHCEGC